MDTTEGSFSAGSGSDADALDGMPPAILIHLPSAAGTSGASGSQPSVSGAFASQPPGPSTTRRRPATQQASRRQAATALRGATASLHRRAVLSASRAPSESMPAAALAAIHFTEQPPEDASAILVNLARATYGPASTQTIENAPEQVAEQAPAASSPAPVALVQAASELASAAQAFQPILNSDPSYPATLATPAHISSGNDRGPCASDVSNIDRTAINPATYKPFGYIPFGRDSDISFSHTGGHTHVDVCSFGCRHDVNEHSTGSIPFRRDDHIFFSDTDGHTGFHICSFGYRHDIEEHSTCIKPAAPYADDDHDMAYSDPLVYEVPRTTL